MLCVVLDSVASEEDSLPLALLVLFLAVLHSLPGPLAPLPIVMMHINAQAVLNSLQCKLNAFRTFVVGCLLKRW